MKILSLHSDKSNFYSKILRICFGFIGLFYLYNSLREYFSNFVFTTDVVLYGILGIFILLVVGLNPTFGANIKIDLNEDFMRIEEDVSYIWTAYWSKVDKLILTRFSIRIRYQSGAPERFRLPFLRSSEQDELREWLQKTSKANGIKFSEKAWWKLF